MRWPFARSRSHGVEMLEPQAAYAMWAPTYPPQAHNPLMEVEEQATLSLLPPVGGRAVLDAGCGSGRYLLALRSRGAKAIGVDLSMPMLARAHAAGSRLARADVGALPIASATIDVVVCGLVLGDVAHLDAAVQELSRVLRRDGTLVYSVVHPAGAEAGWRRTFDVSGRQVAIKSFWHSVDDHRRAVTAAGLQITAWEEPVLREAPGHPAVLVIRASAPPEAGPRNAALARRSHSAQARPQAAEPR